MHEAVKSARDLKNKNAGLAARVNGIEPYASLCRLFGELPKAKTAGQLDTLLSWNAKARLDAAGAQTDAELIA